MDRKRARMWFVQLSQWKWSGQPTKHPYIANEMCPGARNIHTTMLTMVTAMNRRGASKFIHKQFDESWRIVQIREVGTEGFNVMTENVEWWDATFGKMVRLP